MKPPRPAAVRLVTRVARARRRPPRPPLGLDAWSADPDAAVAVLLDGERCDTADPAEVAAQIPRAAELPPATPAFVLGVAIGARRWLRWIGLGSVAVPRASRCAALIARGYVDVMAGTDDATGADVVWGFSSPC